MLYCRYSSGAAPSHYRGCHNGAAVLDQIVGWIAAVSTVLIPKIPYKQKN